MTSKKEPEVLTRKILLPVLAAYYFVLLLFYLAAVVPEWRVWGLNWWAYLPPGHRYGLLLFGVIIGILVYFLRDKLSSTEITGSDKCPTAFLVLSILSTVALVTAFAQFRTATHFLGDGYQLLARLANQEQMVKAWDFGASLLQTALFDLVSGSPDEKALLAYQFWSIGSGAGFLIAIIILSRRLFESNVDRYLFFLGLALGGYTLMFFGYVENYALLTVAIMLYTLVGLQAASRRISIWWLIPPLLLAIFVHLFGLLLVPSFFYFLLRESRVGQRLGRLKGGSKLILIFAIAVAASLAYYLLYTRSYFFKFVLLPPYPDQFTADDNTLFSLKHFADILNLIALLFPGSLLCLPLLFVVPSLRKVFREPPLKFLLSVLVLLLLAAYVINPKLGMPRDWDLFSFPGVPLVLTCYYAVLKVGRRTPSLRLAAILMITLSTLSLAPRVAVHVSPHLAMAHFNNYTRLDKTRSRNARALLVEYFEKTGDAEAAERELRRKHADHPEIQINDRARELVSQGKFAQAIPYARRAIALSPIYWDAYANLGLCYFQLGRSDSALILMRIADGLNPYNAEVAQVMGGIYFSLGDLKKAEEQFAKCLALDSTQYDALHGLAYLHIRHRELDDSFEYISKLYYHRQRDSAYFRSAGDAYLRHGAFSLAARAYAYALDLGLDSAYVEQQQSQYPQLTQ
jgi:Tfp pilus assembly protein PilF